MRRLLWIVLLTGSMVAAALAQTFQISGTVVDHASGKALDKAVVTVALVEQPTNTASYRTGEDGHFLFTRLAPGKYSLSAKRHGYPIQVYQEDDSYSTAIVVGPGLDSENVVFPLSAGGVITGNILDEEGEPVRQAQVMLFRKQISGGMEQILIQNGRQTNSSGEYRFADLKAGTYFLSVQARPWWAQNNPVRQANGTDGEANEREFDAVYPTLYSGGVTNPEAASAIVVTEGSSSNWDFALRAVPALHIQVLGMPAVKPDTGSGINVIPEGLGGFRYGMAGVQVNVDDEHVELTGVAPGRYLVFPSVSGERLESLGSAVVDFRTDGVLDVSTFRSGSLTGRISSEAGTLPQNAMLMLQQAASQSVQVTIGADGTLKPQEYSAPLSGRYDVALYNAPGFYLKSIEAKGATVIGKQLEIPIGAAVQLALVAAPGMTNVNGIALKGDKGAGGAMVLLIPKEPGRAGLIRRDQSDSDGTFTLWEVTPGRYTLLAIDDGHDLQYTDPAAMNAYLDQGTELTAPLSKGTVVKAKIQKRLTETR